MVKKPFITFVWDSVGLDSCEIRGKKTYYFTVHTTKTHIFYNNYKNHEMSRILLCGLSEAQIGLAS